MRNVADGVPSTDHSRVASHKRLGVETVTGENCQQGKKGKEEEESKRRDTVPSETCLSRAAQKTNMKKRNVNEREDLQLVIADARRTRLATNYRQDKDRQYELFNIIDTVTGFHGQTHRTGQRSLSPRGRCCRCTGT